MMTSYKGYSDTDYTHVKAGPRVADAFGALVDAHVAAEAAGRGNAAVVAQHTEHVKNATDAFRTAAEGFCKESSVTAGPGYIIRDLIKAAADEAAARGKGQLSPGC